MPRTTKKRVKVSNKTAEVVVGMPSSGKAARTWLLIADGSQADAYFVEPVTLRLRPMPGAQFRQNDLPGRLVKVANRAHHRLDLRKSPHQLTEDTFLHFVAIQMIAKASKSMPDDLMIAAPPKAMAVLRKILKPAFRERISLEITHEWNRLPKQDVTGRLLEILTGRDADAAARSRNRAPGAVRTAVLAQLTEIKAARARRR